MNNKFVFIIPSYNAEKTIARCIFSVWFQTYENWKIILTDDMSTDSTSDVVLNMKSMLNLSDDKLVLIKNTEKKWEVRNIIDSLKMCDSNDIICRLDGDDWLSDSDALSIINRRYWETGCHVLWTSHRWDFSNINISRDLPMNEDPYKFPWVSSHFKTFRKKMIDGVKDENFRGEDGEYFKRIGDQAIYLPVLHQSKSNWHYEPIVAYHYTIKMEPETFLSDDAKFQKSEAEFLRKRGYIK